MQALEDIRILDLGRYLAGPLCTWILADTGAEVIKIESCSNPDPLRMEAREIYPGGEPGERPWNRSGMINERHRSKYGITLDLTASQGKELFLGLVKISDVVVENFQAQVMDKLGLSYEVLKGVNPSIILVSLSSQGLTGPEKNYRSFGPTLEEIGGLLSITGYPGEPPYISTLAFPDMLAGMLGPGLVVAALRYSRKTGKGLHIDLSQRELTTCVIGENIMDYVMNQRVCAAMGNRHPYLSPYGCYQCKGDDNWVTIAVSSDEQWKILCELIGNPELAEDSRFSDVLSRHNHQDELNRLIEEWTRTQDHYDIQLKLQKAGIAAGAVLNTQELFSDLHLKEREFFDLVTHPEAGTHAYVGRPFKLSKTPGRTRRPAPCLGEHNAYIYGEVLGLSPEKIAELEKQGVIGTIPT